MSHFARISFVGAVACSGFVLSAPYAGAQDLALKLTAETANVARVEVPVHIDLRRWSTDAEREAVVTAWTNPSRPARGNGDGGRGGGFGGGDGFGGFGRGDSDDADAGGGRGGPPAPPTPIESVTTRIQQADSLGYVWTDSPVGFAIKYAASTPLPAGGRRIVLAINQRMDGPASDLTPTEGGTVTDYEITLIELHLDDAGKGRGRTSLTMPVELDASAGILALTDYESAPVVFDGVMTSQ